MLKRTLYFGNPAYLHLNNSQLVIHLPDKGSAPMRTIPIEDIAYIIIDNGQITITQGLLSALLDADVAVITCNEKHLPSGLLLPLSGHTLQSERFTHQLEASLPLKKQLWKQTIQAKITNQAGVLSALGMQTGKMQAWAKDVKSGDTSNYEARAAVYYWKNLFPYTDNFIRDRFGDYPNNLLNYGYAILRAIVARSLVGSGMLPTFGIHHRNRYNAYCLADDIMEPYRPFVDKLVYDIYKESGSQYCELTREVKARLLSIPVIDVIIDGHKSPLMVASTTTAVSLYKCFSGEIRNISYPSFP